jgi:hypothetical protein
MRICIYLHERLTNIFYSSLSTTTYSHVFAISFLFCLAYTYVVSPFLIFICRRRITWPCTKCDQCIYFFPDIFYHRFLNRVEHTGCCVLSFSVSSRPSFSNHTELMKAMKIFFIGNIFLTSKDC